jgi:HAD superfamily hydrolase (TIGR01509 family)
MDMDVCAFRPLGVVFDLDGTLADNMACHARAFEAFVARHGLPPVDMNLRARIDGKRNSEIFPLLFGRALTRAEIRAFELEKESGYRQLSRGAIRPMRGAVRLLDRLEAHGIPVAIATSAPADNVRHTMEECGLAARLPVVARSDQVARGKPAPDVFLAAAAAIGVAPEACLAFEDAPIGVAAATAAGMACVAIRSTFTAAAFAESDPRPLLTVRDFDEYLEGAGRWLESS